MFNSELKVSSLCFSSMLLDESTMYIFPILDRTRCLSSLHLLSSSGLDSHSWRSKLPELHPKSMMLVNGVLRNARRSIDRLATSSRIYSTMSNNRHSRPAGQLFFLQDRLDDIILLDSFLNKVVVVGLLGLESLGQMARIRVQLLYELLELANLDSNLQVIRIGHRTLVVQFVEVTGEDVQNTLKCTHRQTQVDFFQQIRVSKVCSHSHLGKPLTNKTGHVVAVQVVFLDGGHSVQIELLVDHIVGHTVTHLERDVLNNVLVLWIQFVVLGEDLVEFNKNDPVLFVWPVSIVGPVFEQQFGVERSKKRYFLVWRDGHVVFDRVEGSQHQVEQHDGITQFRVELHDHGSE